MVAEPTTPEESQSFSQWSQLLLARLRSLAEEWRLATEHPVLIGTGREQAFASLVDGILPRRFEVLEGALALVREGQPLVTKHQYDQYDIMIADTLEYATLIRNGKSAIVFPQSVRLIAEVKSSLSGPTSPAKRRSAEQGGESAPNNGDGGQVKSVKKLPTPAGVTVGGRLRTVSSKGDSVADAILHLGHAATHVAAGNSRALRMLFSYTGPANLNTLKNWLNTLMELRAAAAKEGAKNAGLSENDVSALSSQSFPDVISVLDSGLYGWKDKDHFRLVSASPEDVLAQLLADVHAETRVAAGVQSTPLNKGALTAAVKVTSSAEQGELGIFLKAALRTKKPEFTVKLRLGEQTEPGISEADRTKE